MRDHLSPIGINVNAPCGTSPLGESSSRGRVSPVSAIEWLDDFIGSSLGELSGKQGGTAECPFVPDVTEGFFDAGLLLTVTRQLALGRV